MDRFDLTARMSAAGARLEALLRSLGPGEADRPVQGLDWTVGDTAAHVITVLRRGLGDRRRAADAAGVVQLNQASIGELTERDPSRLTDLLAADVAATVERVIPRYPLDLEVPFHGGRRVRLDLAWGVVLGELLVHGYDIAAGTEQVGDPDHDLRIDRPRCSTPSRSTASRSATRPSPASPTCSCRRSRRRIDGFVAPQRDAAAARWMAELPALSELRQGERRQPR